MRYGVSFLVRYPAVCFLAALLASIAAIGAPSSPPSETGYELLAGGTGERTGINPAHHVRVSISQTGIQVRPLTPGQPMWSWALSLARLGAPPDLHTVETGRLLASKDRVEIVRDSVREWFVNGSRGVEHGLELSGSGEPGGFHVEFALAGTLGAKVSEDGRTVVFTDAAGAPVLAYRELVARGADGRPIAVRWEPVTRTPFSSSTGLRLAIQGAEHSFPATVTVRLVTPKSTARTAGAQDSEAAPAVLAAPANDTCGGAEVIPGAGPFPYLSGIYDVTDATVLGDPPEPSCQSDISRSVWFEFTPDVTAGYTLSLCADSPTGSTLDDTVLAIYGASGSCSGFSEVAGGCDDDSCGAEDLQSVIQNVLLNAGTTYDIVAWKFGQNPPAAGEGSVQLQVVREPPLPGPPANDRCQNAEVVPGAGPFPYLTSLTADIRGATTSGDPPSPSCQTNVTRSIWYAFTPSSSGRYGFSLCADGPTGTTVDDTVMAIYTGSGSCSGFSEVLGGCDDDSCAFELGQSVIPDIALTAGTTYYVVVWKYDVGLPAAGNTAIQLRVSEVGPENNDTCGGAPAMALDSPAFGTTAFANDNYRIPAGSGCFAGFGHTSTVAGGGDVVYTFTAPQDGTYSFRVTDYEQALNNVVLYVASDCPAGAGPNPVATCLGAANRNSGFPGEEVGCLGLASGQSVYVYVDETSATAGSPFTIEVNACQRETESNDSPAAAQGLVCGVEGSIDPAGDADFFAIGVPDAGSRIFAVVDGVAANSTDFDLRVTTSTGTLEYDDLNNDLPYGSLSPNVSGTPAGGTASLLRVSHYYATSRAEPYRLYGTVQPPPAQATPEVEPNDTVGTAVSGPNRYYSGSLSGSGDVDIFSFTAEAGDLVFLGLDLDPARDGTPFDGALALLDASGSALRVVNDSAFTSSTVPGTGSLGATTPYSPAEAIVYRIRTAGTYHARVSWSGGTPGDYLLSIARDCRIDPATDLQVSQTDAPDPVDPSGSVTYEVTISNLGSHPASVVTLDDSLPAASSFQSATPSQGTCEGSGPVVCHLGTIAGGGLATVSLVVIAPSTPGTMTNSAHVSSVVADPDPVNNTAHEATAVGAAPDGDGDGVPDAEDCAPADPDAWAVPGQAVDLRFPSAVDKTLLAWSPPSSLGGTVVYYDVLRSETADDFMAPACVAYDMTGTTAIDPQTPSQVFYYLCRAENACGGNLGAGSGGSRAGGACP